MEIREIEIPLIDTINTDDNHAKASSDIEDLMSSISNIGLMQPITVCKINGTNRYRLLDGFRRLISVKQLGWSSIGAVILDDLSQEQLNFYTIIRSQTDQKVTARDLEKAYISLYNKYHNLNIIASKAGVPVSTVKKYIKIQRLIPELRELVKNGMLSIKTALRAQDTATKADGSINTEDAVALSSEMKAMTRSEQKALEKMRKELPDAPIEELVNEVKNKKMTEEYTITLHMKDAPCDVKNWINEVIDKKNGKCEEITIHLREDK